MPPVALVAIVRAAMVARAAKKGSMNMSARPGRALKRWTEVKSSQLEMNSVNESDESEQETAELLSPKLIALPSSLSEVSRYARMEAIAGRFIARQASCLGKSAMEIEKIFVTPSKLPIQRRSGRIQRRIIEHRFYTIWPKISRCAAMNLCAD